VLLLALFVCMASAAGDGRIDGGAAAPSAAGDGPTGGGVFLLATLILAGVGAADAVGPNFSA